MEFQELCPAWHGVLFEGKPPKFVSGDKTIFLDIFSSQTCVVSESWGWTDKYYLSALHGKKEGNCEECTKFSHEFITFAQVAYIPLFKKVEGDRDTLIKRFMEHWNSKHAK